MPEKKYVGKDVHGGDVYSNESAPTAPAPLARGSGSSTGMGGTDEEMRKRYPKGSAMPTQAKEGSRFGRAMQIWREEKDKKVEEGGATKQQKAFAK